MITYSTDTIPPIDQQGATHSITGILLHDGVVEDPPPMICYTPLTTQDCVENISPWKFVLNDDTLGCTMMYIPMQFSMYLKTAQ